MLIFDRFSTDDTANNFIKAVQTRFAGLDGKLYQSQDASDEVDPFPCELEGKIVLVDRPDHYNERKDIEAEKDFAIGDKLDSSLTDSEIEQQIEKMVEDFGGVFAGT